MKITANTAVALIISCAALSVLLLTGTYQAQAATCTYATGSQTRYFEPCEGNTIVRDGFTYTLVSQPAPAPRTSVVSQPAPSVSASPVSNNNAAQSNQSVFGAEDLNQLPTGNLQNGARNPGQGAIGPSADPGDEVFTAEDDAIQEAAADESMAAAAAELECAQEATGSSLAESVGGFLQNLGQRALQAGVRQIGGNTNLEGLISGALGGRTGRFAADVITDFTRQNAGRIVQTLGLSGAAGTGAQTFLSGGSIGQSLSRTVGSLFSRSAAGTAAQAGASAAGSAGAASAAGAAGSSAGGASGAVGGGGWPVYDAGNQFSNLMNTISITSGIRGVNVSIDASTAVQRAMQGLLGSIDHSEAIIVHKECVLDAFTRIMRDQMIADDISKRLEGIERGSNQGRALYSRNADAEKKEKQDNSIIALANQLSEEDAAFVRQFYESQHQQQASAEAQAVCEKKTIWEKLMFKAVNPGVCNDDTAARRVQLMDQTLQTAQQAREELENTRRETGGTYTVGICSDPDFHDADEVGCPKGKWIKTAPPSTVSEEYRIIATAGYDLKKECDEAGECGGEEDSAGELLGDFFKYALTRGVDYLVGDINFTIGGGSGGERRTYAQRLSGATRASVAQGQQLTSSNIAQQIEIENQYQAGEEAILGRLQDTSAKYASVASCYENLARGAPTLITSTEALARAESASTTVTQILAPQIADRQASVARTQAGLTQLLGVAENAYGASDAESVNAANARYEELKQSGQVHTTAQLSVLAEDIGPVTASLQTFEQVAGVLLQECQSGGVLPPTILPVTTTTGPPPI